MCCWPRAKLSSRNTVTLIFYTKVADSLAKWTQHECKTIYMSGESEPLRCENCGQIVLASDFECWHCGSSLSNQQAIPPLTKEGQEREESGIDGPALQILFYASMTTVIAVALVLVIRSLGQQPRLAAAVSIEDEPMVELIAPDGSYRIDLPVDSAWYFPQAERSQGAHASQMVGEPEFTSALQPLYGFGSDLDILLTARMNLAVLAIARSNRLGQLTAERVVGSLGDEKFTGSTVLGTESGLSSAGTAVAVITAEQEDPPMICQQHFVPDSDGAYLVAICTSPEQFEEQSADFDAILSSFSIR